MPVRLRPGSFSRGFVCASGRGGRDAQPLPRRARTSRGPGSVPVPPSFERRSGDRPAIRCRSSARSRQRSRRRRSRSWFLGFAGWPRSPARLEVNGGGPGLVIRTRSTVTAAARLRGAGPVNGAPPGDRRSGRHRERAEGTAESRGGDGQGRHPPPFIGDNDLPGLTSLPRSSRRAGDLSRADRRTRGLIAS
jgi:hypothetical protein